MVSVGRSQSAAGPSTPQTATSSIATGSLLAFHPSKWYVLPHPSSCWLLFPYRHTPLAFQTQRSSRPPSSPHVLHAPFTKCFSGANTPCTTKYTRFHRRIICHVQSWAYIATFCNDSQFRLPHPFHCVLSSFASPKHITLTSLSCISQGNFNNSMKAWGILTWKGKLIHNGEERRIHGINSKGWRVMDDKLLFQQQRFPQLSPDLHELYATSQSAPAHPPL